LREAGFRATGDYRSEKVNFKIREASLEKVPYMAVVGEKEQTAGTVAVRDRAMGEGKEADLGAMPVDELIARLSAEVRGKRSRPVSRARAGLSDSAEKFSG